MLPLSDVSSFRGLYEERREKEVTRLGDIIKIAP
jgi:hypothetical protein